MPNSHGASKWAENVGRQALLRFWGGRTSQAPPPLLVLGGAPQKRKVPCSLMFLAHFEVPCLSGMIFATFNLRWELLLFGATFLTQNVTLPGLDIFFLAKGYWPLLATSKMQETVSARALRDS